MESKSNQDHVKILVEAIAASKFAIRNCKLHDFGDFNQVPEFVRKSTELANVKLKCKNCGGKLPIVQIEQYMYGYKAAGGDPHKVMQNYLGK